MKRTWDSLLAKFPFGTAPLVLLIVTSLAGLWVMVHPIAANTATARVWTFVPEHARQYRAAGAAYELLHPGVTIDVQQFDYQTVSTRLRSAFWADLDVPELVDVEISSAGTFFTGPVEEIGFVDLKPRLEASGLLRRMVASRFAPYTNRGHIFGMPHDVHPVLFAYRKDVFDDEHIDPSSIETWDDFIKVGRKLRRLPGEHPDGARYIIQLPKAEGWGVEILMFQRGGGYFDQDGKLTLDDEKVVETVEMYIPLVVGPDRISGDFGSFGQPMVHAMEDGRTLGFLAPDWRCRLFENDMPRLGGKMAVMPLPAVVPGGRRTSTWGGTMIGITKHSKDIDRAWEIAKYLYTDPASWERQWTQTGILPPVKEAWDLPAFHQPSEYWSHQKLGEILASLAPDVPPQYTHPFIELAKNKLSEVVSASSRQFEERGADGFDAFVRQRLHRAADEVRRQMQRNPF